MTTFIKFTNGDTINTSNIQELRKSVKYLSGPGFGSFRNSEETRQAMKRPAIQVLHDQGKELMLGYESEAERDAEFDRIDAIIHAKSKVVFSNLSLNLSTVQAIHADWDRSTLVVTINAGMSEPIVVRIEGDNTENIEKARDLFKDFGLTMPLTLMQKVKKLREVDGL